MCHIDLFVHICPLIIETFDPVIELFRSIAVIKNKYRIGQKNNKEVSRGPGPDLWSIESSLPGPFWQREFSLISLILLHFGGCFNLRFNC